MHAEWTIVAAAILGGFAWHRAEARPGVISAVSWVIFVLAVLLVASTFVRCGV